MIGRDGGLTARDEAGLIQSIRLYHKPLQVAVEFSKTLAKRLKDKVDARSW